ncbi:MAG: outer membrane protein assembly factor BamA [Acidobacteria bacterium]|nr:MAG: outer membrane protein assembly factor BamA [Acidobacteriota bacterium]
MRICAPTRRLLLAVLIAGQLGLLLIGGLTTNARAQEPSAQPTGQKLVEDVQITGNRRNRSADLLYYIQTRQGDPYNPAQVERDFKALMSLGFFKQTESRVYTQDGPHGGVIVYFEVKELPIIRDLQFDGLHSVTESDVLKAFRERRIGVQKENTLDPVKVNNAKRLLKEMLAAKGHPNATVDAKVEDISQSSSALTFQINEGKRVRVVEIEFEGNQVFKGKQLRGAMKYVKEAGLLSRFQGKDILDREKLDADLRLIRNYMASKGYLQGRAGEPRVESVGPRRTGFILPLPLLSSVDEGLRVTIPIIEGRLYRLGDLKIEGNSIFSEERIKALLGLKQGDVASGERVYKAFFEDLKKAYGNNGFIQYVPDPEPTFKDNPTNPKEGIVDYAVTIEEGKQFSLRRLEFQGNTFTRDYVLRREVVLNEGDIYNQGYLEFSILRLNQLGFFDPIDKEKDVDFRQNEERGEVDVTIKVNERGRQQISFNGGISGIGGSFFGLEYSTNNLFGRGESLSINLAAGNRQRSFVFSFTEPYFKNRQISVGFSVYSQSLKYFGEGTFLSQNQSALSGLFGTTTDFLNTSESNLFTQTSTGGSIFASALLSEFRRKTPFNLATRVGLSYTISRTSVKDPEVNRDPNNPNFIPVIYRQPNILTSRVTPSFVYDTRDIRGVDAISGRQLAASFAFAGLGGDVRTYEPTVTYQQFFPVRNKRALIPQVFGFRLLAGHVSSFATSAKVRTAQQSSLAFVEGVPIYERFFLGDEYTIRGYNVRSISPIVPIELFVTSRNIVLATNGSGTPVPVTDLQRFASLGTFTGTTGANPRMISRGFQPIGADTQVLGNFEYRVPIIGTSLSAAAFADIGSAFNIHHGADQIFSSEFQSDPLFLQNLGFVACRGGSAVVSLNSLVACQDSSQLAFLFASGGLVARDNRLVTTEEFVNAQRLGPIDPVTTLPFGFYQIFFRGDAQTNTAVRLSQSVFNKLTDFRSSLGVEVRVQLPVINVPFRLIYAYNPNARRGLSSQVPLIFNEQRSVFRFSVGRTF